MEKITREEPNGRGETTERFFVKREEDAYGNTYWAVLERGDFEVADYEWMIRPRQTRVLLITPDLATAWHECRFLRTSHE